MRNVYDIARRGGDQGNGGSARGAAGEGDGAAGGGTKPTLETAPMVVRIVVLVLPAQVPGQGVVRSQDSTERSWLKSQGFVIRQ